MYQTCQKKLHLYERELENLRIHNKEYSGKIEYFNNFKIEILKKLEYCQLEQKKNNCDHGHGYGQSYQDSYSHEEYAGIGSSLLGSSLHE